MNKCLIFSAVAAGLLAGCATTYRPVVDMRGVNPNRYETDLNACRQEASRVDPGASVAVSGLGGAALGAAVGDNRNAAGVGALLGMIGGQIASDHAQYTIIRDCMARSGYTILSD